MTIGQMIFAIVFILLFLIFLVAAGVWVYAIVKHKDELMFTSLLVILGSNCIIQILNILNHAFGWIQ